jgi:hypothetical protein
MIRSHALFFFTLLLTLCASCATIFSGTTQTVSIDSSVQGATVKVNGIAVGTTPFTGSIKKGKDTVITVESPGYSTYQQAMGTSINPLVIGNLFTGGTTSTTIDLLNGAGWEYSPNTYYINLRKPTETAAAFYRDSSEKAFAMHHFGDLQIELEAGDGEHLRALHSIQATNVSYGDFVGHLHNAQPESAVELASLVSAM